MTAKQTKTPLGLLDLYRTVDDGAEILGAFISVTRRGENVPAARRQYFVSRSARGAVRTSV